MDQPGRVARAGPGRSALVVKPHPAETADVYARRGSDRSAAVAPAPAALDLPTLLAACDLVVTVNSTVAIDAMALGIPALSVGVPNNLTPFVVAGGIAGVYHPSELQPALARLLWDEPARADLVARGLACAESGGVRTDGGAARRRGGRAGRPGRRPAPSRTSAVEPSRPWPL